LGSTPKKSDGGGARGEEGMESSIAPGLLTPSPVAPYGRAVGGEGPRRRQQGVVAKQERPTFLGSTPKKAKMAAAPLPAIFSLARSPRSPRSPSPRSQAPAWERTPAKLPLRLRRCSARSTQGRRSRRKKRSIEQLRSQAGAGERDAKRRSNFLPRLSQVTSCDRLASQKRPFSILRIRPTSVCCRCAVFSAPCGLRAVPSAL
jgi:hypothetical protein